MSQIVMMQAKIAGVEVMTSGLAKLIKLDPARAQQLKSVNMVKLIRELAAKAFTEMANQLSSEFKFSAAKAGSNTIGTISGGHLYSTFQILMDQNGVIQFKTDLYGSGKADAERLQQIFEKMFFGQAYKSAYKLLGYQCKIKTEIKDSGRAGAPRVVITVEGVKQ